MDIHSLFELARRIKDGLIDVSKILSASTHLLRTARPLVNKARPFVRQAATFVADQLSFGEVRPIGDMTSMLLSCITEYMASIYAALVGIYGALALIAVATSSHSVDGWMAFRVLCFTSLAFLISRFFRVHASKHKRGLIDMVRDFKGWPLKFYAPAIIAIVLTWMVVYVGLGVMHQKFT